MGNCGGGGVGPWTYPSHMLLSPDLEKDMLGELLEIAFGEWHQTSPPSPPWKSSVLNPSCYPAEGRLPDNIGTQLPVLIILWHRNISRLSCCTGWPLFHHLTADDKMEGTRADLFMLNQSKVNTQHVRVRGSIMLTHVSCSMNPNSIDEGQFYIFK